MPVKKPKAGNRTTWDMNARSLKPCPFCGERANVEKSDRSRTYYVRCVGCLVMTDADRSDAVAIEDWNRRVNQCP